MSRTARATYLFNVGIGFILNLVGLFALDWWCRGRQKLLKSLVLLVFIQPALLRELNLHNKEEIALYFSALLWHTLAFYLKNLVGVKNFSAGMVDENTAAIKVLNHNAREAGQGLGQGDDDVCRQVVADAREVVVGFFDKMENEIAGCHVGHLIRLAFEHDALSLHGAAWDVELECLVLLNCPLSFALLASVLLLVVHAGALAVVARDSLLPGQAGGDLSVGLLKTHASAAVALVGLDLVFRAGALASIADDLLFGGELDGLALVQLFQCDLVRLLLVRAASRSAPARWTARHTTSHVHTEHRGENIVHIDLGSAGHASGGVEGGHAVGIVEVTLLLIAQDFVGLCHRLELDLGLHLLLLGHLVGVMLQG